MNKKSATVSGSEILIDTNELMRRLNCGRQTAVKIGTAAQARIKVGRSVLWNVARIQKYIDTISE